MPAFKPWIKFETMLLRMHVYGLKNKFNVLKYSREMDGLVNSVKRLYQNIFPLILIVILDV